MAEKRDPIISRIYKKGADSIFVAQVSGEDIKGAVFQYEGWRSSVEQTHERVSSGNADVIQKKFIGKLLDLREDGWSKTNAGTYGHPDLPLFDPAEL